MNPFCAESQELKLWSPPKRPSSDFSTTLPHALTGLQGRWDQRQIHQLDLILGPSSPTRDSRPFELTGCQTPCARASPHPHALTFPQLNGGGWGGREAGGGAGGRGRGGGAGGGAGGEGGSGVWENA